MSEAASPSTGKPYGVSLVCRLWGAPRSSLYASRREQERDSRLLAHRKRGPKTPLSDEELLALIRDDIDSSPFEGEGHRKVWARLRIQREVRVSRKRVLRLMREAHLLSPHRSRPRNPNPHVGEIITREPDVMWGTDGARVFTVEEGWGWIFAAVEHWNSECVGWHVSKRGDRYAALEPVSMGLTDIYGSVEAGVARGLSLRMDHGTQYLADHFQNQIRYWGIAPSFAFVEQPQTNGVAERFIRTLKEQVIYGRIFRNMEEVREVVAAFVKRYNEEWLVEKMGFLSPHQAREAWLNGDLLEKAA